MFHCMTKNCSLKLNHDGDHKYKLRIIIAGGREFNNYELAVNSLYNITKHIFHNKDITIISGNARGADYIGEQIAKNHNTNLEEYPAEWDKYGKSAGYKRNKLMASKADTLLAFWDGKSKGTKHMIDIAYHHGLTVHIINY